MVAEEDQKIFALDTNTLHLPGLGSTLQKRGEPPRWQSAEDANIVVDARK